MRSRLFVFLFGLLFGFYAQGEVRAGVHSNFVTAGLLGINIKSLTYVTAGWDIISFGPLIMADRYHDEYAEIGYGGLFKIGGEFFVHLGGGVLQQTIYTTKKDGLFAVLAPGWHFSSIFTFTLPLIYRSTSHHGEKVHHVDSYPMFGLTARIF